MERMASELSEVPCLFKRLTWVIFQIKISDQNYLYFDEEKTGQAVDDFGDNTKDLKILPPNNNSKQNL